MEYERRERNERSERIERRDRRERRKERIVDGFGVYAQDFVFCFFDWDEAAALL